tara:strand:+ start:1104 stop:1226 length:123 start_codon:yes stop_codon:yes gene_type:complete
MLGSIKKNKCFLWRLMIGKKYQGKRFGKMALAQIIILPNH